MYKSMYVCIYIYIHIHIYIYIYILQSFVTFMDIEDPKVVLDIIPLVQGIFSINSTVMYNMTVGNGQP